MADIGNQLEGVGEGLDRFLEALDEAGYKLGSNAALVATQARAAKKMKDQDLRFKKKLDKLDKAHAKAIKDAQPFHRKLLSGLKDEIKQRLGLTKGMQDLGKETRKFAKEMAKGGLSKGMSMLKGAAKAGIVGALIIGIKVIIDGMLKIDKSMAQLVKATGRARIGLEGMKQAIVEAEGGMGMLGVSLETATKEAANLSQQFGLLDKVTGKVIQTSLKLQMAYGVSAEAAGQLLVTMERLGKNTEEFVSLLAVKAVSAGVNVSLVMRDITAHAQKYAMYSERAQESMLNMAIQSARTGGSLDDIASISSAYADVDTIADKVGKVGQYLGQEVADKLGNPLKLYMMAEQGRWDDLQALHVKAYTHKFKLEKNAQGLYKISHDLLRSQVSAMEEQTGESIVILQNRILEAKQVKEMGILTKEQAKTWELAGESEKETC